MSDKASLLYKPMKCISKNYSIAESIFYFAA